MINAVPGDSTAIAVIDLERLRAAPAYGRLPAAMKALAQPLSGVKQMAVSWNGRDLLLLAAGFSEPPAGYTAIGKGIAAAGPAGRIEAARATLATKALPRLELPQGTGEVRAAIRGDGRLPLADNLANAGTLLSMASSSTLMAHVENAVELELTALSASSAQALQLEESLRAMLTLGAAGTKDAELAALLRDVRIQRENMLVRVNVIASPDSLAKALGTP